MSSRSHHLPEVIDKGLSLKEYHQVKRTQSCCLMGVLNGTNHPASKMLSLGNAVDLICVTVGLMDPSYFLLRSGKSKTPRGTASFSCHPVGKGKLQAPTFHTATKCESEPVSRFILFSWKVDSFKDSNISVGSFPPDHASQDLVIYCFQLQGFWF